MSFWRLLDHLRPLDLYEVPDDHLLHHHAAAIRPTAVCGAQRGQAGFELGYCNLESPDAQPNMECFEDVANLREGKCLPHESWLRLTCPDHCSGVGKCMLGFCSCPPGFFGMDCGLSISASGEPVAWKGPQLTATIDMQHAADMPGLYVYDLQPGWIGDLYQTRYAPTARYSVFLCLSKQYVQAQDQLAVCSLRRRWSAHSGSQIRGTLPSSGCRTGMRKVPRR